MDNNLILIGSRPPRADAVKNRRLLLDTARRLFEEQGVDVVCMSTIAEAAGVGKGTLYRHFASKTEICQALLDDDQRELQERALEFMRANNTSPSSTLHWFLPEAAAFVDRNSAMLYVGVGTETKDSLQHVAHRWWRLTIRGLLQSMHVQGDLDYITDVLYVMVDVQTILFQRKTLGYSYERIINGLHDTIDRLTK